MLIVIDIGNTNSVFACYENDKHLATWRCETKHSRTADEYFAWLAPLMAFENITNKPQSIIVSSTVPRAVFNIRVLAERYFACPILVVGDANCKLGIDIRVDKTTRVGADRLVNTVAAFDLFGGDLIVVDFGTATTFDVVDSDGAYSGGVIAPGVNLSRESLHRAAVALPYIDMAKPARVIGTNTTACMQSGLFWGYIGLIEKIYEKICTERGNTMKLIATGGLAPLFQSGTDIFTDIRPDLTLHGLCLIAKRNT